MNNMAIINLGQVVGPQGPEGPQGIQGIQGAQGIEGKTGNGISSIQKTSTEGKVDTYTIYFTNGSNTTFSVTNGADGETPDMSNYYNKQEINALIGDINTELSSLTTINEEEE